MTNKRYTDEEIVKALECCLCDNLECSQCQNKELDRIECDELATKTIDLINRQKENIERLNKKVEELSDVLSDTIRISYAEAKAEASKEFAERIRECCTSNNDLSADAWLSVTTDIDCVLKELCGGE